MIRPDMATMLAYVTTDAAVAAARPPGDDGRRGGAARSTAISVNAQMSPSDTLLVMAGGDGAPLAGADRDRFAAAWRRSAAGWRSRW